MIGVILLGVADVLLVVLTVAMLWGSDRKRR